MTAIGTIDFPAQNPAAAGEAVVRNARALIEKTRAAHPDWIPPPFDPGLYAAVLGIPVHYESTPQDWDAVFVPLPGRRRIIINARVRSTGRRRFSLAHEIAHSWFDDPSGARYFLRTLDRKAYESDPASAALEKCCDAGAAELLMPQPWFSEELMQCGLGAAAVPEIAGRFAVSLEAAALRIIETREAETAIGFFEFVPPAPRSGGRGGRDAKLESGSYRVRRLFKSGGFPFLFPARKSVPASSAIYRCSLGQKEVFGTEDFELGPIRARLCVSAFPIYGKRRTDCPPPVCAVFEEETNSGG